ncbi:hypothetical protein WG947_00005, partial [Pontibacter sp. H259]|uniref:hypothetical protein n=1 Tax=Pontibacter sp. H259 TaxID=3133421 RepID=UPI0030C328B7
MYVRSLPTQIFFTNQFYQRVLLVLVFILFASVGVQAQNAYTNAGLPVPTVTSDKADYAPGEIATITGTGWVLDRDINVVFKEEPDYPDFHVYDVVVDANGNWEIKYQIETRHLGVKFTVIADGKQSGYQGLAYFTDGTISFATNGLLGNKNITVNWSHTQGSGTAGSTSFVSPGPSSTLGINNQTLTFNYPLIIDGVSYIIKNYTVETTPNKGVTTTSTQISNQLFTGDGSATIKITANYATSLATTNLSVSNASASYGGITTLVATLTSGTNSLSGKSVSFKINGLEKGTAITNSDGVATLSDVSIAGINASSIAYTDFITANFAGEEGVYASSSGKGNLSIGKAA